MNFDFINFVIEKVNIICALVLLPFLLDRYYSVVVVLAFEIEVIELVYF